MKISSNPFGLGKPLLASGIALLCLHFSGNAHASVTLDTVPAWIAGGHPSISQLGTAASSSGNTPTVGETFVDPAGANLLNSFTFYLKGSAGSQISFQGEAFNWFGNLNPGGGPPFG